MVPGHGTKVCTACQANQVTVSLCALALALSLSLTLPLHVQVTVFHEDTVVYSATYDHVYDQHSEQVREIRG